MVLYRTTAVRYRRGKDSGWRFARESLPSFMRENVIPRRTSCRSRQDEVDNGDGWLIRMNR